MGVLKKDLKDKDKDNPKIVFGDDDSIAAGEKTTTGLPSLDRIMGGGVHRDKVYEFWGEESSGKTSAALKIIAERQRGGEKALIVDAERALTKEHLMMMGIDPAEVIIVREREAEAVLDIVISALKTNYFSTILIDSVAALKPKSRDDKKSSGESSIGDLARIMSNAVPTITEVARDTQTTVIFINQMRMKIGVMYGDPRTTPGGNALRFYASMRVEFAPRKSITTGNEVIGRKTFVKITKSKISPPLQSTELDIIFGEGFDEEADWNRSIDEYAEYLGIEKSGGGGWFSIEGTKVGQGVEKHLLNPEFKVVRDALKARLQTLVSLPKSKWETVDFESIEPQIKEFTGKE